MKFKKEHNIVLEVKDNLIDIIVGNELEINFEGTVKLEKGICDDGYIKNIEKVTKDLDSYFIKNNIKEKNISFVVFGSDVITRNIELPYMNGRSLEKTIQFEIDDIISNREQYYVDYEIVKEIKDDFGKKIKFEILIVGCLKKKIDLLVELSDRLNKRLIMIDVLTNTLNKVLINSKIDYDRKTIGLIYFGHNFSNISISTNGVLKLERTIPFGFDNISREIENIKRNNNEKISINNTRGYKEVDEIFLEYPIIKEKVNQFLELIYKTIRFYGSGKSDSGVDKLAIISKIDLNEPILNYIEEYFNIKTSYIKSPKDIGINVKSKNNEVFKYLSLYGLFLRR